MSVSCSLRSYSCKSEAQKIDAYVISSPAPALQNTHLCPDVLVFILQLLNPSLGNGSRAVQNIPYTQPCYCWENPQPLRRSQSSISVPLPLATASFRRWAEPPRRSAFLGMIECHCGASLGMIECHCAASLGIIECHCGAHGAALRALFLTHPYHRLHLNLWWTSWLALCY